jgi:RNA polymerase sigma-70 factor (ECF subfamily)
MSSQMSHGSRDLFGRIAACRPSLLRTARQSVGASDAEDLVQSTIERSLRHQNRFRPETNLLAWMRRIMSNLVIDGWRQQGRIFLDQQVIAESPAPEPCQPPPWHDLGVGDVQQAVARLREPYRTVFQWHYFDGLSYVTIAERMGVRPSTVGTRLLRSRRMVEALVLCTLQEQPAAPVGEQDNVPVEQLARRAAVGVSAPVPMPTALAA